MKNKKILKTILTLSSVFALSASTATIISCHKSPTIDQGWNDFKDGALKEGPAQIVAGANPQEWKKESGFEFDVNPSADNSSHKITATISSTTAKNSAVFAATYIKGESYQATDWVCTTPPPHIPNWNDFKTKALAINITDLFKEGLKKGITDFKWTYGTADQTKWHIDDIPEYDTFGASKTKDKYQGMDGKLKADDKDTKVVAIISKKDKNGAYDSDPITATAQFTYRSLYTISSWTFEKTKSGQLQSVEQFTNLFTTQKNLAKNTANNPKNWTNFMKDNWGNYNGDNSGNSRSKTIQDILAQNGEPGSRPTKFLGGAFNSITTPHHKGIKATIILQLISEPGKPHQYGAQYFDMTLSFNFLFENGEDVNNGGTAFNYTYDISWS